MPASEELRQQQPEDRDDLIDAFLPHGDLPATDPYDDINADQWATTMTVLEHVAQGATIEMGVDAVAGGGNQSRTEIVHAVKRTLREMLVELS